MAEQPAAPARSASGTIARIARVLVVDDEPLICESLRLVLSDEFDVVATTDPSEAVRWLTEGDWYDVVVCDVMMPEMNGVELHDRVRAVRPDLAARIVFATGGRLWSHVQQIVDGVSNTVLEKPFDFGGLRELIRRRTRAEVPAPRTSRM